ncbi:iron-containing redox enzyme family protein [Sorangium sp. So ce131]|uniref:iron-containing redox enzyme family protein n=1 Tax=Sorangium sp. So ce131 TaxID=3133282 RepID=UPI003F5DB7EF
MKIVQQHIARHQTRFHDHPFFARLDKDPPLEQLAPFPFCFTFFALTFQEILRACDERVTDPDIKRMVHRHRLEDAGHDRWFLADLATLGIEPPTGTQLFGPPHDAARQASFALMSEALGARHDACVLTLLLAIESTGHVFFERIARYMARIGETRRLRYFSQSHLDVEKAHDVFDEDTDAQLEALVLAPEVRDEALQLVDRCYRDLIAMYDGIEAQIAARAAGAPSVRSRPRPAIGAGRHMSSAPPPRPFARHALPLEVARRRR